MSKELTQVVYEQIIDVQSQTINDLLEVNESLSELVLKLSGTQVSQSFTYKSNVDTIEVPTGEEQDNE